MTRAITAAIAAFVVAMSLVFVGSDRGPTDGTRVAGVTMSTMAGSWAGEAEIAVNWTTQPTLRVRLSLASDGRATGTIGDAVLRNGRLERNRTAIGRALHVKTDWIVRGDLDGDVIRAEGIRRDSVALPLNWVDEHFEGSVNTSGTHFGGRDSMWLAALRLRLNREGE
ncbi:MAG: hypothetical protein ABIQ52_08010 [Vicinamibacterales bacterium]